MLLPKDVEKKILKQEFENKNNLTQRLLGQRPYPIKINLQLPTEKKQAADFKSYQHFLEKWRDYPQQKFVKRIDKAYSFMQSTNLPCEFVINNEDEFLEFLPPAYSKEIRTFVTRANALSLLFPNTQKEDFYFLLKRIIKFSSDDFEKILNVIPQLHENLGNGTLFIRALPLKGIDTKFLENSDNEFIIMATLKVAGIIKENLCNDLEEKNIDEITNLDSVQETSSLSSISTEKDITNNEKNLETEINDTTLSKFLNVREKPKGFINVMLLDPELYHYYHGLSMFKISQEELYLKDLPCDNILVVENEQSGYMLPTLRNTIAIFGCGKNLAWSKADWLKSKKKIFYWGDLDSHGFAMLANFRENVGSRVQSILMDRKTIELHLEGRVNEPSSETSIKINQLTDDEQNALKFLQSSELNRLEQEKLEGEYVFHKLKSALE